MKPKRIMSFLLSIAMTVSILSSFTITALAEETQTTATEKNITLGTTALKGGQLSNVYFGNYQQSEYTPTTNPGTTIINTVYTDSDGTKFVWYGRKYYKIEPIKWRVLSNADGKTFMVSDQNIDRVLYHAKAVPSPNTITWAESTVRSWLNGYSATFNKKNEDYSTNNFINSAFETAEKGAMVNTTVINNDNSKYTIDGGENTTDKLFLLSIDEVNNSVYFKDADSKKAENTAYTVTMGGKIYSTGYGR